MGFGDSFGCWNSHHFLEFHKGLHLLATKRTVEDLGIGVGVVSRRVLTPFPFGLGTPPSVNSSLWSPPQKEIHGSAIDICINLDVNSIWKLRKISRKVRDSLGKGILIDDIFCEVC